jgi:multiple sugar transport system substrate-binding protein
MQRLKGGTIMKRMMIGVAIAGAVVAPAAITSAWAEAACSGTLKILAQPRDGLTLLEKSKGEFEKLSGASYQIDYLNENDRRAKSKADAATVGTYNIYYIDEANVSLFASSKWVVPILDYYPKDYDYADFDAGMQKVASFDGAPYFAPITGGGDLFVYRKDLLEKAGIKPPKTVEELKVAAKALTDPAHGIYGIGLRGERGSGANVWRWMPYFRGYGGKWFDGDKPAFDSDAAVHATQDYLELFKYSPPGTKTGSWDESTGAFLAGNVAMIIESSPLGSMAIEPKQSTVVGKVGFAAPPSPLTGGGYAHGFAVAAKANPDDAAKKCAALWIAWATSKEQEQRRLAEDQLTEITRTSTMKSDAFKKIVGPDLAEALAESAPITTVNFWQNPNWPALGDHWGIELEELIVGTRTDIKGSLKELDTFSKDLVSGNQ